MSDPFDLNPADKYELVGALLNCECMKSTASRDQVVGQLPPLISRNIDRFPSDKKDVLSIIDACRRHADGLESLWQAVQFLEDGSEPWRRLVEVRRRIFSRAGDRGDVTRRMLDDASRDAAGGVVDDALMKALLKRIEEEQRAAAGRGSPGQRDTYLENVMHEIDYTEVGAFLERGARLHSDDGFAALCMIQRSTGMGGKWCLKRIQSWLNERGPAPVEVNITPSEGETVDARFILGRLAAKFDGPHPTETLTAYAQSIIQRICGSIYVGGRLLIVIRQWEDYVDQEAALDWLLNDFWRPLVRAFRRGENRSRARLLVVVMTDDEIVQPDAAGRCCAPEDFDCEKIVSLQLRAWHEWELANWLMDYWGQPLELTRARATAMAEKIYRASFNGDPLKIYELARNRLLK